MKIVKPPHRRERFENEHHLFFAGSIEMGKAKLWQDKLANDLRAVEDELEGHIVIYNPRRDHWDSSWDQSDTHEEFVGQVNWELDHATNESAITVFYFDKDTKSPVTLLELGLVAADPDAPTPVVFCPKGYWRKGNVDIVCQRYGVEQVNSHKELVEWIKNRLKMYETDPFETGIE